MRSEKQIQRVDEIPLVIYWLLKMRVDEFIDRVLPHPHPNRQGLSYGQLALLFVAYVPLGHRHSPADPPPERDGLWPRGKSGCRTTTWSWKRLLFGPLVPRRQPMTGWAIC